MAHVGPRRFIRSPAPNLFLAIRHSLLEAFGKPPQPKGAAPIAVGGDGPADAGPDGVPRRS